MLHLNDHLYTKLMCLLYATNFWCHTVGFSRLNTFIVGIMSNHKYRIFYPRWYLSLFAITRHIFSLPFYSIVQLCWTLSNGTEPIQSITKRSVDYNHALTHIQCDVHVHMQCNAPLHVISCHMYNECYMDNTIHTTHRVSWTNLISCI